MKTGYSTHAINFGMRMIELDHSFTINEGTGNSNSNSNITGVTLHVCQAPPNVAIMPPGTAWFYVVVDGVPSVGVKVMVGTGVIEQQPTADVESLPESSTIVDSNGNPIGSGGSGSGGKSAAGRMVERWWRDVGGRGVCSVMAGLLAISAALLS
jgi:hypothetical protein